VDFAVIRKFIFLHLTLRTKKKCKLNKQKQNKKQTGFSDLSKLALIIQNYVVKFAEIVDIHYATIRQKHQNFSIF